jgi:hypothetical protein
VELKIILVFEDGRLEVLQMHSSGAAFTQFGHLICCASAVTFLSGLLPLEASQSVVTFECPL